MQWCSPGCVGPDEEHGARGVVDDVARGGPEAVRATTRAILVACEHEDVRSASGRDHLALDAAGACVEHGHAPEGSLRLGDKFARVLLRDRAERLAARPARPAEQTVAGVAGYGLGVARPDIQGVTSASTGRKAAAAATVGCQVSATIQTRARITGPLSRRTTAAAPSRSERRR